MRNSREMCRAAHACVRDAGKLVRACVRHLLRHRRLPKRHFELRLERSVPARVGDTVSRRAAACRRAAIYAHLPELLEVELPVAVKVVLVHYLLRLLRRQRRAISVRVEPLDALAVGKRIGQLISRHGAVLVGVEDAEGALDLLVVQPIATIASAAVAPSLRALHALQYIMVVHEPGPCLRLALQDCSRFN